MLTERSPQWDASIVLTANRAYEMNNFKLFIPTCGLVKQINHSKMLFYHSIERLYVFQLFITLWIFYIQSKQKLLIQHKDWLLTSVSILLYAKYQLARLKWSMCSNCCWTRPLWWFCSCVCVLVCKSHEAFESEGSTSNLLMKSAVRVGLWLHRQTHC